MSKKNISELILTKVNTVIERQPGIWVGTMTNLKTALHRVSSKNQRALLPASPAALRIAINRIANRLRNRGIGVRFSRTTDHARTRYVRFTQ
jgi:hypothetical protein